MKNIMVALVLSSLISGCSSLDLQAMMAAMRLAPLKIPPEDITIALSVPDTVELTSGDAILYLGFKADRSLFIEPIEHSAPLDIQFMPIAENLSRRTDTNVFLGRVSNSEAASLKEVQAQILNLKNSGVEGAGTFAVQIRGGCYRGELPDRLPVSTWIQTQPNGDFVPLTRDSDLWEVLDNKSATELKARMTSCGVRRSQPRASVSSRCCSSNWQAD